MRLSPARTACLLLAIAFAPATAAHAAQCGNDAAGFPAWLEQFKQEAVANGISPQTVERALGDASYANKTISLDRGQTSFSLSLDQFMQKRGAHVIISKGKRLKEQHASLLSRIEQRYGVPPGPLLAIWGMETGFGNFLGNRSTIDALATLAYDCRRSEFFTNELYAALRLIDMGELSASATGAGHGEIGQTQFLPSSYLRFAVDGDGDGDRDLVNSKADALASTANYLRSYGWQPGAGYQPGQANFGAIQAWNAASVYQQAIAIIGAEIDEG